MHITARGVNEGQAAICTIPSNGQIRKTGTKAAAAVSAKKINPCIARQSMRLMTSLPFMGCV